MSKSNLEDLELIQSQYEIDYYNRLGCVLEDFGEEVERRMNYYYTHRGYFYKKDWHRIELRLRMLISKLPYTLKIDDDWNVHLTVTNFRTFRRSRCSRWIDDMKDAYAELDDYDSCIANLKRKPTKEKKNECDE